MKTVEVVEYTDPGCVWSWGSEPQLRWLRERYGAQLTWRRVIGVQVDAQEATDPEPFRASWLAVSEDTRAPVPERLAWIHRSTQPAAAAVHAAALQNDQASDVVLRRLREAVFVLGRPADDAARVAEALEGAVGVDVARLLDALDAPEVLARVEAGFEEARTPRPGIPTRPDGGGRERYGFPTLILRGPGGEEVVTGWRTPDELSAAVLRAGARPIDTTTPLDPDTALSRHRTLTIRDLEVLTGGREPVGAVVVPTATTPLWVHPDEAPRLLSALASDPARAAAA